MKRLISLFLVTLTIISVIPFELIVAPAQSTVSESVTSSAPEVIQETVTDNTEATAELLSESQSDTDDRRQVGPVVKNERATVTCNLHAWFSTTEYGETPDRFYVGDWLYINFEMTDKSTNLPLDESGDFSYTVDLQLYGPDGTLELENTSPITNDKNRIAIRRNRGGVYTAKIIVSGDFSGTMELECELEYDAYISCTTSSVSLNLDGTATRQLVFTPGGAYPGSKGYRWSVDNGDIATISEHYWSDGQFYYTVQGKRYGETILRVELYEAYTDNKETVATLDIPIRVTASITSMSANSTYGASVSTAGQVKYYSYTPSTSGTYVIYSTGSIDTKVYLYDASGNDITYNDDGGAEQNFRLEYNLVAGTTYIYGVRYYSSDRTGTISFKFGRVYTVSYNANGGSGAPSSQSKDYGTTLTLSTTEPARSGYTFLGWATSSDATSAAYQPGGSFTSNSNTTLYAVWKSNTGSITYNANGGSGAPSAQTGSTSYTISSTVPARFGYTFLGWSTSSTATSASYKPGNSITANSDITLYAVWKSAVTFSAGTTYSPQVEFANQEVYYVFTPSSDGSYTFESSGSLDSKIYVYNSSGSEIGYDDDSSDAGTNFKLTIELTSDTTYYIKVRAYSNYTGTTSFSAIGKYTISYDANGGSGAPSSQTKTHGTTLTLSTTVPTRSNYTFLGWATSSDATSADYQPGGSFTLNSKTTLYAVWGSVDPSLTVDSSNTATVSSGGQVKYFTFTPQTSGVYVIYSTGTTATNTGSVDTMVYLYNSSGTQISYDDDGGGDRNFRLAYNLTAGTTYKYGIKYYRSDTTGTISFKFGRVYTVSYNANRGSGAPDSQTKDFDKAITLKTDMPARSGYTFLGWATSSTATSAEYQPGDTFNLNSDTTLYAVWQSDIPELTVDSANSAVISTGGEIEYYLYTPTTGGTHVIYSTGSVDTVVYLYDSNGTQIASNDDGGEGNNFRLEYNLTAGTTYKYGVKYYSSSKTGTISFKFGRIYTLSYDSGGISSQTKDYGTVITLSSTIPVRNDYTFLGWSTSATDTEVEYMPGDSFTFESNVTLYAVWELNRYTVSYDANGGSGAPSSDIKIHGTALTLSTTVPIRQGYTFLGWSTDDSATSATYQPGDTFTYNDDTILYAVWRINSSGLVADSVNSAVISAGGEKKYFSFTPSVSGKYVIYSTESLDTYVSLYNSNGSKIATNDDGGAGLNFRLEYNLVAGTTYEYEIKYLSTSQTGTISFKFGHVYTVSYNANGGSGAPSAQSKDYGTDISLSTTEPSREGYVFFGWSRNSTATSAEYQPGDIFAVDADTALYAVWASDTEVKAIDITSAPSKTSYYIGDSLNTSGLSVTVTYESGRTEVITSGFVTSGFSSSSTGTKTVTVSYGGFTDRFTVTVNTPSITLSQSNITIEELFTDTITATTTPDGMSVTWTSSDTGVATVSGGTVAAKNAGRATITAQFTYNGIVYKDTCTVTVTDPSLVSISVHTVPDKTVYEIGERLDTTGLRLKLNYSNGAVEYVTSGFTTSGFDSETDGTKTVTVTYGGKTTSFSVYINPATVTDIQITSNPTKTTYYIGDSLDTSGLGLKLTYSDGNVRTITGGFTTSGFDSSSSGTKTVTVHFLEFTDTFTVTVNSPSITLSKSTLIIEELLTATLTATTAPGGQSVTWTSSDTSVATVSGGTVTAKNAGRATITAKFTYNGNTYSRTCTVTVIEPTLTSVSIYATPVKIVYDIGESLDTTGLELKLNYSNGRTGYVTSGFTTSGFDSSTPGDKTVTVTYNGKTASFTVTINQPKVIDVEIKSVPTKTTYYKGDSLNTDGLKLKLIYNDGTNVVVESGFTVSGFSSASAGTKTITVSYNGMSDSFSVTVKTPSVNLSKSNITLEELLTATLTATTAPGGQSVTWTSSDTKVATVSNGTVTAKKAGTAVITAKFTYNGNTYSKSCTVTVIEPTLTEISVQTNPSKTVYEIGEALDTTGLELKLRYSNGKIEYVTRGFTTSGFSSSTAGSKTVVVTYNGKTTSFTVTVNQPRVVNIEIISSPTQTSYCVGDVLNTDGLSIKLIYSDNTIRIITRDFDGIDIDYDFDSIGKKTVTVTYEGLSNTFTVTVGSCSVTLSQTKITIDELLSVKLVATTVPGGQSVTWVSSDTSVATVSSDGVITAKKAGNADITAYMTYNGVTYNRKCYVTVTEPVLELISVNTAPDKTVYEIGEELDTTGLELKLTYSNGTSEYITSGFTVSGFSSATMGTKAVNVAYNDKTTSFTVTVNPPRVIDIQIERNPSKTAYYIGDTLDTSGLRIKLVYNDGTTKTTTGDFSISGFGSTSAGTKTVTVSYGGFTDTFTVTVSEPVITLSKTAFTLEEFSRKTLTATTTPGAQSITWLSSDTDIVSVSDGTVTARAAGTATVTAYFVYNGITYSKSCTVTVTEKAYDEDFPAFTVESTMAKAGGTFTVALQAVNNPGIASVKLTVNYDSDILIFDSANTGEFDGAVIEELMNGSVEICWNSDGNTNNTTDGTIVYLTFKVKENADIGSTEIRVSYDYEDVCNSGHNDVAFDTVNGIVDVVEYISGDVNGDGKVNINDLDLLRQYLNYWEVVIDETAADVNRDGKLNNKDYGLLQQYLNNWDVTLK